MPESTYFRDPRNRVAPLRHRSMLIAGLRILLKRPRALLWTFALHLGVAVLFSLGLHARLSDVLDHSLAAERLSSAFDLGTLIALSERLTAHTPSSGVAPALGVPVFLLIYFLLVPGVLFCYQASVPARLSIMLSSGLTFFWRFVRITLLTLLVSAAVLIPLATLAGAWSRHLDELTPQPYTFLLKLLGVLPLLLAAAALRLYFDFVEVYTVQLADQLRPNGRQDRRVRRTLRPALRLLGQRFAESYTVFLLLALAGLAAVWFTGQIALHMLASPRVWPMFLVAQVGLFLMMLTRFWQRAAETSLVCDNPLARPKPVHPVHDLVPPAAILYPAHQFEDAQPDPEPAVPSLAEPDPGVFHPEDGASEDGASEGGVSTGG